MNNNLNENSIEKFLKDEAKTTDKTQTVQTKQQVQTTQTHQQVQTAQTRQQVQTTQTAQTKTGTEEKKKPGCLLSLIQMILLLPLYLVINKKTRPFVLIAVLAAGLIWGVPKLTGGANPMEAMAQAKAEKEAQEQAAKEAEFIAQGDALMAEGKYNEAAKVYAQANEAGKKKVSDAHRAAAEAKFEDGDITEAYEYLSAQTDCFTEAEAAEFVLDLALAKQKALDEKIRASMKPGAAGTYRYAAEEPWLKETEAWSSSVSGLPQSKLKTLEDLNNQILGYISLLNNPYDLEEVWEHWNKCPEGSPAAELMGTIQTLAGPNPLEPFRQLQQTVPEDALAGIVEYYLPKYYHGEQESLGFFMEYLTIRKWAELRENKTTEPEDLAQTKLNKDDLRLGIGYHGPYQELTAEEKKLLKEICGSDPQGKILILHNQQNFYSGKKELSICGDLMLMLPSRYMAGTPEEAEYIILLDSTFTRRGKYMTGTVAIAETTSLTVYDVQTGKKLLTKTEKGEISNTMYYTGKAPTYYSAGSPRMHEPLQEALSLIAGKLNG